MSDAAENPPLTCFVIGPIGSERAAHGSAERIAYEEALQIMHEVIEPACAECGIVPDRADRLPRPGELTEQIFRRLHDADIVIADLTDANPNVMYELGLRHTRNKLTIQIGEVGRLPFDVTTIRTIQFNRTTYDLIDARKRLAAFVIGGIRGEFDPVTATRVWNESATSGASSGDKQNSLDESSGAEGDDDSPEAYFMDILADAEEHGEALSPATDAIAQYMVELGEAAQDFGEKLERSDASGGSMRAKLQIVAQYASALDRIGKPMDAAIDHYAQTLRGVSAGNFILIERMEQDAKALEEGREFGITIRGLARTTQESMEGLDGMTDAIRETAKASKLLKDPTRRLVSAFAKFRKETAIIQEWDRRLAALGIPLPPYEDENQTGNGAEGPSA
jgi:hypothetical protein